MESDHYVILANKVPHSSGRMRWTCDQKTKALAFFNKNIETKTAPKKNECLEFISQHKSLFDVVDWVRVKTFIYNTYRGK